MVPQRAFGDKCLKARHFRVLGSICRAVDPQRCAALISVKTIAKRASLSPQRVHGAIRDLEQLGYIKRIKRPPTKSGRFRSNVYGILYEEVSRDDRQAPGATSSQVTPGGDNDRITPRGERSESPPGVRHSYPYSSNLPSFSKAGAATPLRKQPKSELDNTDGSASETASADNSPIDQARAGTVTRSDQKKMLRNALSRHGSKDHEQEFDNTVMHKMMRALSRDIPDDHRHQALQLLSPGLQAKVKELERERPGKGVGHMVRELRQQLRLP
jgi:hypothetical protein